MPTLRPGPPGAPMRSLKYIAVILLLLGLPVAFTAFGTALGYFRLPYELAPVDERLPVVFRLHMLAAALAILLLAGAVATQGLKLHKYLGRSAACLVAVAGTTALPVAIYSAASGPARYGFFLQGIAWLSFLAAGFVAIRSRRRDLHMWFMLAVAGVASGAIWIRLMIWIAIKMDLSFEALYALAAWLSWIGPTSVIFLAAYLNGGATRRDQT